MTNLIVTKNKQTFTSLELVEQINIFRREEKGDIFKTLAHADLLKIIRNEFDEEIAEGKISESLYKDKNNQSRPMFELSFNECKQVLIRESKHVRKQVIKYVDELEKQLQSLSIPSYQIDDPVKRAERWIEEQKQTQLIEQQNLLLTSANQDLQIELDEHEAWYSVKRVCLLDHFKNSEAKKLWRKLKEYSIKHNYQIKSIFDANYGEVKTYHREVWKGVYNIELD